MDDLISRDFIKSLGGECIAARDSKTHELLPISSIDALPPAQPELIRCKDCKWWGYDGEKGAFRECNAAKHWHMSPNWNIMICRTYKEDFYCGHAERRTE